MFESRANGTVPVGATSDKKRACRVAGQGDRAWECHLEPVGGKVVTEWRVWSGAICGKADVLFKADSGQELIANVYLPITNKECP